MSCGIFSPAQCVLDAARMVDDFSAELFWQLATAPLTLVVIAIIAILAYAIAHVPFVEKFFPVTAPFIASARIVCLVCAAALIFLIGHRAADQRAELERARSDLAWTEFQLAAQKRTVDDAAELKQTAESDAAQAKGRLAQYQEKFGNDPTAAVCPPRPGVVEWVHDLQRRKPAGPNAAKAKRGLVDRLRRSGAERR
ncbi:MULTISPECIES: hypothetical protein [unclassified Bradyrhizobium]|uniref:hypothetical protein n=1 Tax=unclassified Bradyrhizobium TaxID=2631580 RepID=UPI00211ED2A5|nr:MULTISPECIES: hypothetical protein [unclassified Bradyrhizobium]MDD1534599.1 hypothetical protein [Bradyrhizobium sp. WBOS8]MDD1581463.1 hypothetical protein [Bradyrhizobium sp. WBOS4]UUO49749.1 hypothetical protein DCM78_24255 [Bradyrhizobium sp. WBOS04]UUO58515.1 hypothetical protein DCM80_04535 [Bradyrhizobium sp. WBOS08]